MSQQTFAEKVYFSSAYGINTFIYWCWVGKKKEKKNNVKKSHTFETRKDEILILLIVVFCSRPCACAYMSTMNYSLSTEYIHFGKWFGKWNRM